MSVPGGERDFLLDIPVIWMFAICPWCYWGKSTCGGSVIWILRGTGLAFAEQAFVRSILENTKGFQSHFLRDQMPIIQST